MDYTEQTGNGHTDNGATTPSVIGIHKAKDLAEELGISSSTLTSRWLPWLYKAVDPGLIKANGRYTDLAKELFEDFKARVKREENPMDSWAWVAEVKEAYAPIEEAVPVEAEVVVPPPNDVDTALVPYEETMTTFDDILNGLTLGNTSIVEAAETLADAASFSDQETLESVLLVEAEYGRRIGALRYVARKKGESGMLEQLKRRDASSFQTEAAT